MFSKPVPEAEFYEEHEPDVACCHSDLRLSRRNYYIFCGGCGMQWMPVTDPTGNSVAHLPYRKIAKMKAVA